MSLPHSSSGLFWGLFWDPKSPRVPTPPDQQGQWSHRDCGPGCHHPLCPPVPPGKPSDSHGRLPSPSAYLHPQCPVRKQSQVQKVTHNRLPPHITSNEQLSPPTAWEVSAPNPNTTHAATGGCAGGTQGPAQPARSRGLSPEGTQGSTPRHAEGPTRAHCRQDRGLRVRGGPGTGHCHLFRAGGCRKPAPSKLPLQVQPCFRTAH